MLHKCCYEQFFVVSWPQVPAKHSTQLLIHPTPTTWGENKDCEQENSWVERKTRKPLIKYHCRQNRPDLGNLIVFIVHEHEHLITDLGSGKWINKEVEQLKQLSSLLLRFKFSPSISPPTSVPSVTHGLGSGSGISLPLLPAHSCPVLQRSPVVMCIHRLWSLPGVPVLPWSTSSLFPLLFSPLPLWCFLPFLRQIFTETPPAWLRLSHTLWLVCWSCVQNRQPWPLLTEITPAAETLPWAHVWILLAWKLFLTFCSLNYP